MKMNNLCIYINKCIVDRWKSGKLGVLPNPSPPPLFWLNLSGATLGVSARPTQLPGKGPSVEAQELIKITRETIAEEEMWYR